MRLPIQSVLLCLAFAFVATGCSAPQQTGHNADADLTPPPSIGADAIDPWDPVEPDPFFQPSEGPTRAAPASSGRANDDLERALEALSDEDIAGARALLQRWVDDPEVGGTALHNLGVVAFYEGQQSAAVDYWQRAIQRDPTLSDPLFALVRVALRDGDRAGARRLVESQRAASGDLPAIRAATLLILHDEQRYNDVISEGRAVLLLDSANLDVHYLMGLAYLETDRPQIARYIFDQGLLRDATRVDLNFGLALVEIRAGNNPGARGYLNRVLAQNPFHVEALNNLGQMQFQSRAYADAVDSFQRAIRHAPTYREAWLNLGNAYKGVADAMEAYRAYERAAELDPTFPDPWFNLAVLLLEREVDGLTGTARYERSIEHFDHYLRLAERSGSVDSTVAALRQQAVDMLEAQRTLDRAPPPRERGPADGAGDDPFGDDPFGDDPFGDDPFGDDPFGDDPFGDDPFGDDPFGDDPFGDDPFGDDPFGDDPFGDE
jgi:tetratricopeptide (TPR) repeat protein